MKPISLTDLRQANEARQKYWPGYGNATPEFRAIEFGGESGEALDAFKKVLRAQLEIGGRQKTLQDVADEMGDVLVTLDLWAASLGIDLNDALRNTFNCTSEKQQIGVYL